MTWPPTTECYGECASPLPSQVKQGLLECIQCVITDAQTTRDVHLCQL